MRADEVRSGFLAFFAERGHEIVPSAPLPAAGDPSLMFVNSGMVPFKEIFLGRQDPKHRRVTNSQKCLRVSGKHNDLEDVGRDTYHQTFFEMLGYWSFDDYFKREAIGWIWELLTGVWGLPKDRLYATVFGGDEEDGLGRDEEAADLWAEVTDIDSSHIQFWGKKDNFWEMAETGPCGPNSEIHIDLTEDGSGAGLVNRDDPRVIELGNIVFIQHSRAPDRSLSPLPARHIDFGGGFERLVAVLQGKSSNYDTDLFVPIFEALQGLSGAAAYGGSLSDPVDIAYRVVADHVRCLTFAITDDIIPSNEGPGYVLRRILRRAARYGRQSLGLDRPFLAELVPVLAETMGGAYPELRRSPEAVAGIIGEEERSFQRTLGRGIALFEEAVGEGVISGAQAFRLYDTYGFPLDLTQVMAEERGLSVDAEGFERLMTEARQLSRAGAKDKTLQDLQLDVPPTEFLGYELLELPAPVLVLVREGEPVRRALEGEEVDVIFDVTPFYAESGGQVGDKGALVASDAEAEVLDTQKVGSAYVHRSRVTKGELYPGMQMRLRVDAARREGAAQAHTATHVLHHTLRSVLGEHVRQMGSLVEPGRLRFDFSHFSGVERDSLEQIEEIINLRIEDNDAVKAFETSYREALDRYKAMAFFEEKYGDVVRVVGIGDYSYELCGGTHVPHTGHVGFVKVLGEGSIGSNIRRVEALTGAEGLRWVNTRLRAAEQAAQLVRVGPDELVGGVERLLKTQKELEKALAAQQRSGLAGIAEELAGKARTVGDSRLLVERRSEEAGLLRELAVAVRDKLGRAFVVLGTASDGSANLVAAASKELGVDAREILRGAAARIDGGAGGKPDLAMAGGRRPEALDEALAVAAEEAESALG